MPRHPQPWFRSERGQWFVQVNGKQHPLGADRDEAFRRYHVLMGEPKKALPVQSESAVAIIDDFLEWTQKNRAPDTYEWYLAHLQAFVNSLPDLSVSELKPYHVVEYLDSRTGWSNGSRRGAVIAIKRAFNWAEKLGYVERNPIRALEKPPADRREHPVTSEEWKLLQEFIRDRQFRELLTVAYETEPVPRNFYELKLGMSMSRTIVGYFPPKSRNLAANRELSISRIRCGELQSGS